MIQQYYEEEMRYLREAGQAFAEAHPEIARYLNVGSLTDRDPYVERLFEGFAFLAGRIHERLDDDLPIYTESLLGLLAPHLAKPFPACCVVELTPKAGLLQETTVMPKGTEVRSRPVGEARAECRFTTTHDVPVQPLTLADVRLAWQGGRSSATLRFEVERGVDPAKLDLGALRLFFKDVPDQAALLHLFFTRHVERVTARSGPGDVVVLGGQERVRPAGFADDEGLLPDAPNSLTGLRLLQEYWCFRPKFWFVDLLGLGALRFGGDARGFEVEVQFDRAFPEERRVTRDNLRLHCTPAVNLFEMDGEPIRVEGLATEYLVRPSDRRGDAIEVYEIEEVVGIEDRTGQRHTYEPYLSFRHASGRAGQRHFTARRRLVQRGLDETGRPRRSLETSVSLGTPGGDGAPPPAETLSLHLTCTNGSLPFLLSEGQVELLAHDVPQVVRPTNLTKPSLILYPPVDDRPAYFWKMISHWSFNFRSVASREALTGLLDLYDWSVRERPANRKRLRGIDAVSWEPCERQERRAILRGAEVTLKIKEDAFENEGDLCLFGLVLSEFFSLYATINSFVHLQIETVPSGKHFTWRPKSGIRPTL